MAPTQLQNDLAKTIEAGDVALGVLDNAYSPTLIELYGELGLDFVWLDLEHGGPDPWAGETLEHHLRAAQAVDTELLVRVPGTDPTLVRKALDLGVRNVFLPRIEDPDEVRQAVRSGRFRYEDGSGDRGLAAPRAARWGLNEDYIETEDEEVLVGTMVESQESIAKLDDILAIPELGFVFIGPYDLSVSLGHPGEITHPDVQEAVETIRSQAVAADVPVAGLAFDMEDANAKAADGYQLLNLGTTAGAIRQTVDGWLAAYDG